MPINCIIQYTPIGRPNGFWSQYTTRFSDFEILSADCCHSPIVSHTRCQIYNTLWIHQLSLYFSETSIYTMHTQDDMLLVLINNQTIVHSISLWLTCLKHGESQNPVMKYTDHKTGFTILLVYFSFQISGLHYNNWYKT